MRPSLLLLIGLAGASAACGSVDPAEQGSASAEEAIEAIDVALDDVAILFPLSLDLWPASRVIEGDRPLLPVALVRELVDLVAGDPNTTTYAALRVVSLRLEPCFRATPSARCERQIRFVLQPISSDAATGATSAIDSAVHVLYKLPSRSFSDLAKRVVALRGPASSRTLGVHPVLAAEGMRGAFARGLESSVFDALKTGRLVRVTALGLRGRGNEWQMGGVDVRADGTTTALEIPGTRARLQSVVLQRGAETFVKSISPRSPQSDDVALLFDSLSAESAERTDVAGAVRAANRIENPELRTSEDTDCATCHVATSSRLWAETKLGVRDGEGRFAVSGFDLSTPSARVADHGVLRAFGWFGTEPVVSPRVVNDTARAAAYLRGTR